MKKVLVMKFSSSTYGENHQTVQNGVLVANALDILEKKDISIFFLFKVSVSLGRTVLSKKKKLQSILSSRSL